MKINFTKKEYRLLVEMLYLADWMMNAHEIEPVHKEHQELKEKIFSHNKEMEAEDIEEYSFDEYMHEKFIFSYDNNVFWEELLELLSERDAIKEIGSEKYHSLDGIEKGMLIDKFKERYAAEFEKNRLENVKIERNILIQDPL